jgi:hypothetical protein
MKTKPLKWNVSCKQIGILIRRDQALFHEASKTTLSPYGCGHTRKTTKISEEQWFLKTKIAAKSDMLEVIERFPS